VLCRPLHETPSTCTALQAEEHSHHVHQTPQRARQLQGSTYSIDRLLECRLRRRIVDPKPALVTLTASLDDRLDPRREEPKAALTAEA
jgi:hypothetical protein